MKLSAGDRRRTSGSASTEAGASQIVIIMKTRVSNVTCHRFRGMRYVIVTRLNNRSALRTCVAVDFSYFFEFLQVKGERNF